MGPKKGENPYAITLGELESKVRVPFDDQVAEQETVRPTDSGTDWDELRRQMLLAGGA